jgi:phosphoglycolate phosphatase
VTPPTLVFDLDGTLVDTAPDLVRALNAVIAAEGLPPVPLDKALTMVGRGARMLIRSAFAAEGQNVEGAELERLFKAFIDRYAEHVAEESRPYPGVEASLDRFAAAGWLLAVLTNKPDPLARPILEALGLASRFAAIVGQGALPWLKPDPRVFAQTVRMAGGTPQRAVMVGDSETDIETARAAGIPVVAVTFGYTPEPVATFGPDRLIDHFDELWNAVASLGSFSAR